MANEQDIIEPEIVTDDQAVTVIEPDQEQLTVEQKFIRNLFLYNSHKEAAIEAGYSESYATGPLYQRVKTQAFQNKLVAYAKANDVLALPDILKHERKALQHLDTLEGDDLIKALAKLKHTTTQKKQIAGLLRPEDTAKPAVTINIRDVRKLMVKA